MRHDKHFLQNVTINSLLVISVLLSCLLTGLIFMSFGKNEISEGTQSGEQQAEIFRPTQYIISKQNGKQYITLSTVGSNVTKIENALKQAKITKKSTQTRSASEINKLLSLKQAQIFGYPDVVPIAYFNLRYNQHITKQKHGMNAFNYFVLDLKKGHTGYLINTKKNQVMTVKISGLDEKKIWQKANQLKTDVSVKFETYQGHALLNYPDNFKLPTYSYLVNRRDPKTYVSALLGTSNQLSVTSNDHTTTYTNKLSSQKIVYDANQETVTFEDANQQNKLPTRYVERLNSAFSQINLLQLDFDDLRFYEAKESGQQITFRTYVKSFPVYFQSASGAIQFEIKANGTQKSVYSLNEIGLPVPNDNASAALESTNTILKKLKQAGVKSSDYDLITPGYEWMVNDSSQATVNMNPIWMIETTDGWQTVENYINTKTTASLQN